VADLLLLSRCPESGWDDLRNAFVVGETVLSEVWRDADPPEEPSSEKGGTGADDIRMSVRPARLLADPVMPLSVRDTRKFVEAAVFGVDNEVGFWVVVVVADGKGDVAGVASNFGDESKSSAGGPGEGGRDEDESGGGLRAAGDSIVVWAWMPGD